MYHKICKNCVLDTSIDIITFDKKGVCNYCQNYKKNNVNLNSSLDLKKMKLQKFVNKMKRYRVNKNKKYDCLIGVSGGLDSSYLVYYSVKVLGLNPLLFHVDAGWNSNISSTNIEKLVERFNLDLITHIIDWEEMKDLHLSYFQAGVPSIDTIQDHAFFGAMYDYVEKNKIKYVLTGANFATEFLRSPLSWAYHASDTKQIKDIHKKFGKVKLNSFPFYDIFRSRIYLRILKGVKIYYPLNFINYNKFEAEGILKKEIDWLEYDGKHHESRFTAFFENYWSFKRFGHDRRKLHLSSLILSNQIKRQDALNIISKSPISEEKEKKDIKYVCDKLDISVSELKKYFNLSKKTYRDYASNYQIINFATKILTLLKFEKKIYK